MASTALALVMLAGVALYLMTREERARLARAALDATAHAIRAAKQGLLPGEPFSDALRARTGWVVATPILIALNALIFVSMAFDAGALSDPQTLIDWGGNFAPRTTNGEWWRLIAATFVHTGMLHLLVTIAALLPLGLVLERAVGRLAFAAIYVASGILASVVSLWTTPALDVSTGASGAIFGIYGLMLASLIWAIVGRATMLIPLITVKRICAAAGVFFLYNLVTDALSTTSEVAGLTTGFVGGLVVARGITRGKPPVRRAALVTAATVLIAVVVALPVRGVADVRPEIARVIAFEERTTGAYDAAVAKFRKSRITSEALARLIDRTIMPELQATHARLKALRGVPREHVPLVGAADEYLQLREQSWRRRAEALLKSNMAMLREADRTERAALEAFRKLRPAA